MSNSRDPSAESSSCIGRRIRASHSLSILSCVIILCVLAGLSLRLAAAQDQIDEQTNQEIFANLDAGRVVIAVAKDGIVIATLENPIEPGTRPPDIVELPGQRAAILLGALDWWLPDEHEELANINVELPTLPSPTGANLPHLDTAVAGDEAMDIERIADRLHARLNWVLSHVHGNLNLPDGQPIAEMLLADYAPDYGPEVWVIQYPLEQDPLQGSYWQSTVLPPQYSQLWPLDKDQPVTAGNDLLEVDYPEPAGPALTQLLTTGDPRISQAISASPALQGVSEAILNGDLKKMNAVDVAAFLRACLGAIAPPHARMIEAEVNKEQGIGWFIAPPPEPARPGSEQPRPPGAPSLRKPGGPGR